jgi:protein-export SecD/SecF family membrane protein
MQNLRWKLALVAAITIIFGAVGVYPIVAAHYGVTSPSWLMDKQLKLGLDLKGGVHLVLRVQTDDALRLETEGDAERLREELQTKNIPTTAITSTSATQFKVEGVPPDQDAAFRQAAADLGLNTNFDRTPGVNGTYTFNMKPNVQVNLRDEAVVQARETIERRVNELGVTEPSIAQQGSNGDQILVQLPGVTDVDRAKEIIRSTGLLELKIVENGPAATREQLMQNGQVPPGMDIVPGAGGPGEGANVFYLVRKAAAVTGRDLRSARPTLGADSIRSGVIASVVGLLAVMLFMLAYYHLSGVNAVVALVLNLVILLGLMAYVGAVMTLPGIAGFVLTMGIGVDSNVLIFERIKEELEAGRGVRASINTGFSRVFLTLLDTHIAALISAAFLFQFGTGPIRGFAVTLSVGLLSNLFTSTFVSKTLYELALANRRQVATLSI